MKQLLQNHILVGGCGLAAGITCLVCLFLGVSSFTDGNEDEVTMYAEIAFFTGGLSAILFHFAGIARHSIESKDDERNE